MMIRGLQKQMIQLSTPKSRYFEVVCFVLRPELSRESAKEADMLREAQKILAQAEPAPKEKTSKVRRPVALFWLGLVSGALSTGLVALLARLLA